MFDDDNQPNKKPPYRLGQDLSDMSVDDLRETIEELKAEIARLEADTQAKQNSKSAADAFFKS